MPILPSPRTISDLECFIAREVKQRRRAKGFSQKYMSELLGVSHQQLQKYENETNRIPVGRLVEISQILGFSLDEMVTTCQNIQSQSTQSTP